MNCARCDKPVPPYRFGRPRKFCSKTCTRRAGKRAKRSSDRAKRRGATIIERIDPIEVFKADRWTCQICFDPLEPGLAGTLEDKAACLDHILALCLGGQHRRENVQTACRSCNIAKARRERAVLAWRRPAESDA